MCQYRQDLRNTKQTVYLGKKGQRFQCLGDWNEWRGTIILVQHITGHLRNLWLRNHHLMQWGLLSETVCIQEANHSNIRKTHSMQASTTSLLGLDIIILEIFMSPKNLGNSAYISFLLTFYLNLTYICI